jgi:hypothetical protein
MQDELIRLQKTMQRTVVFITHDFAEALRLGDRIAIMKDGSFDQIGTPEEIVANPATPYVREFVNDVPRAKVLSVKTVTVDGQPSVGGRTVVSTAKIETIIPMLLERDETITVVDANNWSCQQTKRCCYFAGRTTMSTALAHQADPSRLLPSNPFARIAALVTVAFVAAQTFGTGGFPESWNIGIAEPIKGVQSWVRENRSSNWSFRFIFNPLISIVEFGLNSVESFFLWLPWFIPPVIVFLIIARTRRWGVATFTSCVVVYPGVVGVWPESIVTISLMAVSVAISILIGVPLGVLTALNKRFESILRPILDGMQTVPARCN